MIMKYFDEKAKIISNEQKADCPDWVSASNASLGAWRFTEQLKREKTRYIKSHFRKTHFTLKSSYQIKPSEIAKGIGINRSTLMHTSTYSKNFSKYLKDANEDLAALKVRSLTNDENPQLRGSFRNTKDQLLIANEELKKKLAALESIKSEEIVRLAFDQLPLPIKRKFGID